MPTSSFCKRSQSQVLMLQYSQWFVWWSCFISGLEYVKQLCVPEYNTVEMEVASKYVEVAQDPINMPNAARDNLKKHIMMEKLKGQGLAG